MLTESTKQALADPTYYCIRELDRVIVIGKAEPVTVYKVLDGEPQAIKDYKLATKETIQQAIHLSQQQFAEAIEGLKDCLTQAPDDLAFQLYLTRCEQAQTQGIRADWSGVERLTSK